MPYKITPGQSQFLVTKDTPIDGALTLYGGTAPVQDNGLIVQASAFLVDLTPDPADFSNQNDPFMTFALGLLAGSNSKPWNIAINDSLWSEHNFGLVLAPGFSGTSIISVGADAEIGVGSTANGDRGGFAVALGSTTALTNSGSIEGVVGISSAIGGTYAVTNSDSIAGTSGAAILFDLNGGGIKTGTNTIKNSGTLYEGIYSNTTDELDDLTIEKITNSGTINGDIATNTGNDSLSNSGAILGAVYLGPGNDKFSNFGMIDSAVDLGVDLGDGNDPATNGVTGDVKGWFVLGEGTDKLTNLGMLEAVYGGDGNDTVTNTAVVSGVARHGKIGWVDLENGDDSFIGGKFIDTVGDGNGADQVSLGGGADWYDATGATGTDGGDSVDGGAGSDFYDAGSATASVVLNLDSVNHTENLIVYAKHSAKGADVSGDLGLKDIIINFENARGGGGADILLGSSAANELIGNAGADELRGYAGDDKLFGDAGDDLLVGGAGNDGLVGGDGNDRLEGGAGADSLFGEAGVDILIGGLGQDVLSGGLDADSFVFVTTADSGLTKSTRDFIFDFTSEDLIDLALIDANTTIARDQAFTDVLRNIAFSGVAGQLHTYYTVTGHVLEGDVNGDGKADFAIDILDRTHALSFSATDGVDFIL
ncbi:MAG: calcium-binding protein [Gammaproteobacteria bacterium]|nr:calcium-binding protein [Gammaproteobacteria bacterium]